MKIPTFANAASTSACLTLLTVLAACGGSAAKEPATPAVESAVASTTKATEHAAIYDFDAKSIDGEPVRLGRYAGKVLLIVNVASKCGYTPQYEALEKLYETHEREGLVVLGFPSDQFGHQEPGTENEIKTFCKTLYGIRFPMFAKVEVNGPSATPLYRYLRAEQPGAFSKDLPGAEKLYAHLEKSMPEVLGNDAVKWNFTKFLVDRQGKVVKRFESPETPEAIEPQIVALLAKQ